MPVEKIRLQKYLSRAGVASRREAERWISLGRISVNDRIVIEQGTVVDPEEDTVKVDGHVVTLEKNIYIILHKPSGYLCSMKDNFGRPLVTDLIRDIPQRIYHVGRLDLDSEGLLIMTNDGSFGQLLTHPGHQVDKTYRVKLRHPLDNQRVEQLIRGVEIDDGVVTAPARLRILSRDRRRIEIIIQEGKKRQVKRMLRAVGNRVTSLKRIAIGPVQLGDLPRGRWRRLTSLEIQTLKNAAGDGKIREKA
jgi:23S rRNA pseudouridine2605 synthase